MFPFNCETPFERWLEHKLIHNRGSLATWGEPRVRTSAEIVSFSVPVGFSSSFGVCA